MRIGITTARIRPAKPPFRFDIKSSLGMIWLQIAMMKNKVTVTMIFLAVEFQLHNEPKHLFKAPLLHSTFNIGVAMIGMVMNMATT